MRTLTVALTGLFVFALPLLAQEASKPSLVPDLALRSSDSPLVRAAKSAVASRLAKPSRVIDNSTVSSAQGTFTTTTSAPEIPTFGSMYPGGQPGAIPAPPPIAAQPDRAAMEKKARELRVEQERMHAEAEEPYGGDISEDQVDQRLQQIPGEIGRVQQGLNQTPQAPATPQATPPSAAKPPGDSL